MKRSASSITLGAVCLLFAVAPGKSRVDALGAGEKPTDARTGLIAITNVTVIDVKTGARTSDLTVLIRNDRIDAIAPSLSIPPGAARVNGSGKFLIPGLWDMHTHHQATGAESLDLFVAEGIVGTRDMGGDADFILPLRERVKSGAVLGPEIFASGPILDDAPVAFPYRRRVRTAAEARQAVHDLKQLGVDFIKVHDHTPREAFFAIADEAPKIGLTFAGHVPMNVTIEEAANAGMRSIEHLANFRVWGDCSAGDTYNPKTCAALFDRLAANGVWETPTLEFFQTLPAVFSGTPLPHAEYASDSLMALTRDNIRLSHVEPKVLDKYRLANRLTLRVIPDMYAHGSQLLAGCDGIVPGFCLHSELAWFTRAGLTPLQSLQTATLNPARFLGREPSEGTVEQGKRANLVLLDSDPTIDIRNLDRIAAVILGGKLLEKAALERSIQRHRRTNVTGNF